MENCKVRRKKQVKRRMVYFGTGETVPNTEEKYWVEEECGTPLFGEFKDGVCRSCREGWKAPTNYPVDTALNRVIVPHYFDDVYKP